MTASIVEALQKLSPSELEKVKATRPHYNVDSTVDYLDKESPHQLNNEKLTQDQDSQICEEKSKTIPQVHLQNLNVPDISEPKVGNPITHRQIIDLYESMKSRAKGLYRLENLLRGAEIYIPPPSCQPEKTSEYKSLMKRLRQEEEARSYLLMTRTSPPGAPTRHFPAASAALAFSSHHPSVLDESDEMTYVDIRRQVTLIFNVLISVLACGVAIWIVARWLSTPLRFALSFGGSLLVGIAEVVVYSGYIRRITESKLKERGIKETKKVIQRWEIGANKSINITNEQKESVLLDDRNGVQSTAARRRK